MATTVRVSHDGPVTTISINRPEVRNAVDRETAEALAAASGRSMRTRTPPSQSLPVRVELSALEPI